MTVKINFLWIQSQNLHNSFVVARMKCLQLTNRVFSMRQNPEKHTNPTYIPVIEMFSLEVKQYPFKTLNWLRSIQSTLHDT